ncbi:nitroreductase [Nocardioides jiangxiensis]|uniref:Nitroreductase n=1 Tax=Nocardioides jiangxiensis TaxID=3064524 RepID=A0ABT9B3U9_9ACTN|nr:nitroreductase [Nocardioides sp. WY-20]MDO7869055.1 nitroreductase [Nocardioides sp. WY-20]
MTSDAFASLAALQDRRSTCRAYADEPVPAETLDALLRMAQRTASWCNTQPWQVEVVSGAALVDLREALVAHVLSSPTSPDLEWPTSFPGVYGERRRECGFQLYDALGIERSDKDARFVQMLKNFEFFGAPHVAIVHTPAELGPYGAVDAGLWLQSFLLGAEALGLGAAPQAALASYGAFFREWFGLGEDRMVVFGVSFGFPAADAPVNGFRTDRAAVSDAVRLH